MSQPWSRRALLALGCAALTLLSACGSGSIESAIAPPRLVVFGTGMSDLGEGGSRYTVNDGSVSIWSQQLATRYGLTLTTAAQGGLSFAQGNARVTAKPDVAGSLSTRTIQEQVDRFLTANNIGTTDVVLIEGGVSDVIAEVGAWRSGRQSESEMIANLTAAGRALGSVVRKVVVTGGARYVLVTGTYNLGRSPWARRLAQAEAIQAASLRFNEGLLVSIGDLGANVLYVDAALHYNLVTFNPSLYGGMTNAVDIACGRVDPGPGIGIGAGQVNSALCEPANTVSSGVPYTQRVFADEVYPTPTAQRSFGDFAYESLRRRW